MDIARLRVIFDGDASGAQRASDTAARSFDKAATASRKATDRINRDQGALAGAFRDASGRLRAANGRFLTEAERLQVEGGRRFRLFSVDANGALGKVLGGFGNLSRGAVSGLATMTSAVASAAGTGFVALQQAAQGAARFVSRALGAAASGAASIGSAMSSAGQAITSGLMRPIEAATGAVVKLTIAGGALGAVFSGVAFKGGYDRLSSIEDATTALTITLGDATKATKLLDEVMKVVTGTPYAFDQFASAAQRLVAMGIAADDVPTYLRAIGNASATQGKRAGEFADRLTLVFGQMNAAGRVMSQDMLQLTEAAVPAWKILANHFGVTTEEMREMVTEGAVPAKEAMDVLTKGIMEGSKGVAGTTAALGGVMDGLGKTTSGAMANMRTAISRMGANAIKPVFGLLPGLLNRNIERVDAMGIRMGELVQRFIDSKFAKDAVAALGDAMGFLGEMVRRVAEWAAGIDWAPKFQAAGDVIKAAVIEPLKELWGWLAAIGPTALEVADTVREKLGAAFERLGVDRIAKLVQGIVLVGAAIGPVLLVVGKFVSAFGFVLTIGSKLAGVVAALLSPVGLAAIAVAGLAAAGVWLYDNFEPFTNLVDTIVEKVTGFASTLADLGVEGVVGAIGEKFEWLTGAVSGPLDDTIGHLGRLGDAGKTTLDSLGSIAGSAADAVTRNSGKAKSSFSKFAESVTGGVSHITDALGSIGAVVGDVFSGVAGWFRDNEDTVDKWAGTLGSIFGRVGEVIGLAMEAIKEVVELVLGILIQAWSIFGDDLVSAVEGVFNGVLGIIDGVLQTITGVFDLFIGIFTGDWSRAWDGIKNIFGGVWNAIYALIRGAWDLIFAVVRGALDLVWRIIQGAWDVILGVFRWAWNTIKDVVSGGVGAVVDFVKGIPDKLGGFVGGIFDGVKNAMTSAKDWVGDRIEDILDFVRDLPGKVTRAARGVWDGIKDAFASMLTKLVEAWNRLDLNFTVPDIYGVPRRGETFDLIPDFPMPKFHTGGVYSGGSGPQREGPAILQNGEGVFTPDQMRALGLRASRGGDTTVHFAPVIHADGRTDTAEIRRLLEQERRELIRQLKALGVGLAGV